jgi:ketosteroid isomerase-like protein
MPSRARVLALIAEVERGHYVEALRAFYTEDASMQENLDAPRRGIGELIANEERILGAFKIRTLPGSRAVVEGDRAVINWVFEITTPEGRTFRQDELAFQLWQGDRIVEERFYYDPGQRKP